MDELLRKRFLLVTGKGGVGKSTVACWLALQAAARGKRVLLANVRDGRQIASLSGLKEPLPRTAPVAVPGQPRVSVVEVHAHEALVEYASMVIKVPFVSRMVFDNKTFSGFLRSVPGLDAWAILGKAYFHAHRDTSGSQPRYDLVVFDAPATGHCLEMLAVPQVIERVAPPGLLRREATEACALLRDEARAAVVLVTLAEHFAQTESEELQAALGRLGMHMGLRLWNQMLPPDVSEEMLAALPDTPPLAALKQRLALYLKRSLQQRACQENLRSRAPAPERELPWLSAEALGPFLATPLPA